MLSPALMKQLQLQTQLDGTFKIINNRHKMKYNKMIYTIVYIYFYIGI